MALTTGRLGTALSMLGNILLGTGDAFIPLPNTATDSLNFTEVAVPGHVTSQTATNTLSFTQVAIPGHVVTEICGDTFTMTQSLMEQYGTFAADTLVFTETPAFNVYWSAAGTDTIVFSQTVHTSNTINTVPSDTLSLTELVNVERRVLTSDTITFTETLSFVKYKIGIASDTIVFIQTAAVSPIHGRPVAQALVMTQVASYTRTTNQSASDTLVFTQSAPAYEAAPAYDTLVFTEVASVIKVHTTSDLLAINSIATVSQTTNWPAFDQFIPFQRLSTSNTIRRTITDTLIFEENIVAWRVLNCSDTLTFTQTASAIDARPTFDVLVFDEDVPLSKSLGEPVLHLLVLSEQVDVTVSRALHVVRTMAFEEHASATKMRPMFVQQSLFLSEQLWRDLFVKDINETITFNEVVEGQKISAQSVSDLLVFTESDTTPAKTTVLLCSDTLVFLPSSNRNTGFSTVAVPTVQVIVVQNYVRLQTDTKLIMLPPAEFNDGIRGTSKINIKRAMDGKRYVYKRTQPTNKLHYDFILDRRKALELKAFLLTENSKPITMENWKGEIWSVQLVNNPTNIVEEAFWDDSTSVLKWGNKCRVTLEFQGAKLN